MLTSLPPCTSTGFGTYPGRKRGALHPQVIMFPCPACQGDVDLGERGLAGLFRNLTLERVVERYRQSVSVGGAILCQLCKPPPLEATKGCTECRATFCNECFKLFHPWGTQKAQHEPTLPTLSFRPKVSQPWKSLRREGRGGAARWGASPGLWARERRWVEVRLCRAPLSVTTTAKRHRTSL